MGASLVGAGEANGLDEARVSGVKCELGDDVMDGTAAESHPAVTPAHEVRHRQVACQVGRCLLCG